MVKFSLTGRKNVLLLNGHKRIAAAAELMHFSAVNKI